MAYVAYLRYSESQRNREPQRTMIERYCISHDITSCALYEEVSDGYGDYRNRKLGHVLFVKLMPGDILICPDAHTLTDSLRDLVSIINTCKNLDVKTMCVHGDYELTACRAVSCEMADAFRKYQEVS